MAKIANLDGSKTSTEQRYALVDIFKPHTLTPAQRDGDWAYGVSIAFSAHQHLSLLGTVDDLELFAAELQDFCDGVRRGDI